MAPYSGCRLILADVSDAAGGHRVKTVGSQPVSMVAVMDLLTQHLGFQELCGKRGFDAATLTVDDGSLTVTGIDGYKRVPLKSDSGLMSFFAGIKYTPIPSVEVILGRRRAVLPADEEPAAPAPEKAPAQAAAARDVPAEDAATCRQPVGKVEFLEDANFKLLRAIDRLDFRIDEQNRKLKEATDAMNLQIERSEQRINDAQEKLKQEVDETADELRQSDQSILADLDVVRQFGFELEKVENTHNEEHKKAREDLTGRMEKMFDDVDAQIRALQEKDAALQAEDERQQAVLDEHRAELDRLDEVKLEVETFNEKMTELDKRITKEMKEIHKKADRIEQEADFKITEAKVIEATHNKEINEALEAHRQKSQEERDRIEQELGQKADNVREECLADTATKVQALAESTQERFDETKAVILQKDAEINARVDELRAMTESTFKAINERFEEFIRVSRARFGQVEKDLAEGLASNRADCRNEVERNRSDFEQEAARLDSDLGDLHCKFDVTKQEISFLQEKLNEQREWAQRQLTETATATKAVKVDAQEGLAACTKMLHALRDDAVTFREKMGNCVRLLQHSSDSQGDAITALEVHRGRIRSDLDLLITDHKAYTGDMDGWADDVRMKVERLFRAMEPARVEWRIHRAAKKAKELKKPLGVKSPTFSLRGLDEVQLEFFPEGTNNSPDDKSVLRVYLPPGAHVRFQVWVGFLTEGPVESKPNQSITMDLLVDNWIAQVQESDGCLPVQMEMQRDYSNEDESLATEVRIESP